MKYLCVKNLKENKDSKTDLTSEVIITFPDIISHDKMFDTIKLGNKKAELVSAGFISKDKNNEHYCHGVSYSLDVKSRGMTDTILYNMSINNC